MSRLVARLLLALLMLPTAGLLWIVVFVLLMETWGYRMGTTAMWTACALSLLYIAVYWLVLWSGSVRWTGWRLGMTAVVCVLALGVGMICWAVGRVVDDEFAVFFGSTATTLAWLMSTIFAWRETSAERMARLGALSGAITCLNCGYNLTGLKRTQCPECGAEPTVEELLAGQPSRADAELTSAAE